MDNTDRLAVHTRHRTKTNKPMDNPDKLPTQVTGRRPTTQWTIQINWKHKTHVEDKQEQTIHLDKLSTLDTQDTGRRHTRTDNPSR